MERLKVRLNLFDLHNAKGHSLMDDLQEQIENNQIRVDS